MNLKNIKAYNLFLITSIIILLIGFYRSTDPKSSLDLNVHDTYFVMSNYHCTIILFSLYFLTGLLYWVFEKLPKKQLIKPLTIIHTFIFIGSFVFYWIIILYSNHLKSDPNFPLLNDGNQLINITLVNEFLLIFFIAIPIFIINLLIGLFKRSNQGQVF